VPINSQITWRTIPLPLPNEAASPHRHPAQRGSRTTLTPQANAYAMIQRAAGIATKRSNHSFRATGITAYLKNGGTLEKAAAMANHSSTRATQLLRSPVRRGEPQ
jgi:integrase